jgi:hypothetical protein
MLFSDSSLTMALTCSPVEAADIFPTNGLKVSATSGRLKCAQRLLNSHPVQTRDAMLEEKQQRRFESGGVRQFLGVKMGGLVMTRTEFPCCLSKP